MKPRTIEDRKVIQINVSEARRVMNEKRMQEEIAWAEYAVAMSMLGCSYTEEIEHVQGKVRSLIRRGKSMEDALRIVGINEPEPAA
jgi:hypothetical protein